MAAAACCAPGRIRDAQDCYQESLKIVRDLDDPRLLAQTYSMWLPGSARQTSS